MFLIHDGARYHTSVETKEFFTTHADRLQEHPAAVVFAGL